MVLQANPNIICGGTLHSSLLGIGTPMFVLNVALLPFGTLAVLVFGKNSAECTILTHPKSL